MAKAAKIMVTALTLVVFGAIFASTASAETPVCSTAGNGNVTCVQQTLGQEATATDSTSVSVKAASNGKAKITLLVAEHFVSSAQMQEARKNGECHWYKEVWNSGFVDGTGKLGWKLDHHVYGCWVNGKLYKYGGGITGDACGNLLRLVREPPPKTAVHAKAEFVAYMKWTATAHITATAPATATAVVSVHNADNSCQSSASGMGTATGTATATAKVTARSKAAARASAEGKAVKMSGGLNQEASVKASAAAKASATAQASAKATCTPTVPPPPTCQETGTCPKPPPTCEETGTCPPGFYTEIGCVGFEEISGEAGFHVECTVSTNTGKPISLEAHSNDSNSQVSGINCYTNSGQPTCPSSGGTFEFFVEGNNNSSSVKYSSITAIASAGGVQSTPFTSDPFKVDPKEGGF